MFPCSSSYICSCIGSSLVRVNIISSGARVSGKELASFFHCSPPDTQLPGARIDSNPSEGTRLDVGPSVDLLIVGPDDFF